jgi:hypothetical protein
MLSRTILPRLASIVGVAVLTAACSSPSSDSTSNGSGGSHGSGGGGSTGKGGDSTSASYTLRLSKSPTRKPAADLTGMTLAGDVYIFTSDASGTSALTGIQEVRYWLDDPKMTGAPIRIDSRSAFDLVGTAGDGSAEAWDTSKVPGGLHTLTQSVKTSSGAVRIFTAPFGIDNGSLAKGTQARSADDFVDSIGVGTHLNYLDLVYGTKFDSVIAPELVKSGIRHIRDGIDNWPDPTDTRFKSLATAHGIKVTAVCGIDNNNPDEADHCITHADEMSTALEAFEGANELDNDDGSWKTDYARFQVALYHAVKGSKYASLPVLSNALAGSDRGNQLVIPAGVDLPSFMDFGNMHTYPITLTPTNGIAQHILDYQTYVSGDKPLMVTETGYHNAIGATQCLTWWPGVSEAASGKYAARTYLEYFNSGIKRSFIYELIDERVDPTCNEDNFGLLRNDGTEKPAYKVVANLIALLRDPGAPFTPRRLDYSLSGASSLVHQTLLAKRDGRVYLVLWQDAVSYDTGAKHDVAVAAQTVTVKVSDAFSVAHIYLPFVSSAVSSSTVSPSLLQVDVPDHPVVIELVPSTDD